MSEVFRELENKGNTAEALKMGVVDIRQVAESFEFLQRVIDAAKAAQNKLAPSLMENNVSEMFPDHEDKVVIVEGSTKTSMKADVVQRFCTPTAFAAMVSVSEKAIRDTYKGMDGEGFSEKPEVIIAKAKVTNGKNSDSVKVKKMTKAEIKESQQG